MDPRAGRVTEQKTGPRGANVLAALKAESDADISTRGRLPQDRPRAPVPTSVPNTMGVCDHYPENPGER